MKANTARALITYWNALIFASAICLYALIYIQMFTVKVFHVINVCNSAWLGNS